MTTLEILRWLVVANAVVLIVQAIRVIATYGAVYSLAEDKKKAQLPLHVWMIALSYLIYLCGTTYVLTQSSDYQFTRIALYGVAGLLGQYALWNVLSYEKRRYAAQNEYRDQA